MEERLKGMTWRPSTLERKKEAAHAAWGHAAKRKGKEKSLGMREKRNGQQAWGHSRANKAGEHAGQVGNQKEQAWRGATREKRKVSRPGPAARLAAGLPLLGLWPGLLGCDLGFRAATWASVGPKKHRQNNK